MGSQVLIVDSDPSRRAALRSGLALPEGEVTDLAVPSDLSAAVAKARPGLLLLDAGDGDAALDALRDLRARPGPPLPAIALVPADRPDLRLAALAAGAEDATDRDTGARLLQARVRSLLRQRDDAMGLAPPPEDGGREGAWPGLAEGPAAFAHALCHPRARVALLSAWPNGALPPADAVARLLGAQVDRLRSAADLGGEGGEAYDLVVIDGAGTRGDLAQGAQVLALLADLQGRQRGGPASTLVLLPGSAMETAALALDLGAGDVVTGPVAPREVALRARALIARRRLREAVLDQVRLGLRAAVTDSLTGLHNRRYAEATIPRMADRGRGLALLMIDIDHFKAINDGWGHATGDRVLAEVARRLRSVLRPTDLLVRHGGEEFVAALPDTTLDEAQVVAERLRRAVGGRPFVLDCGGAELVGSWGGPCLPRLRTLDGSAVGTFGFCRLPVTVSLGVAAHSAGSEFGLDSLLRRADVALYQAKDAGRNAVVLAAPEVA